MFLEITQKYLLGMVRFVAVFAVTQKDAIEVQPPLAVVGLFNLNHWRQILAQRPEGLVGMPSDDNREILSEIDGMLRIQNNGEVSLSRKTRITFERGTRPRLPQTHILPHRAELWQRPEQEQFA